MTAKITAVHPVLMVRDVPRSIDFYAHLGFESAFRDDPETEAVVLIGEIGGRGEEEAAAYLDTLDYGKPVVTLVVGRHAPRGRRMGHAGTLSVLGGGTAADKIARLRAARVEIAADADDVVAAVSRARAQAARTGTAG